MQKELNDFQDIRKFIKHFIIEDEELLKTVYYSVSSPLTLGLPLSPYDIFPEDNPDYNNELSDEHGVVLFRRKYDQVQSHEGVTILVETISSRHGNSYFFNSTFVIFNIILKGTNVQTLSDGSSRLGVISRKIINNFDRAIVNNIGEVRFASEKLLSLNEENSGKAIFFELKTCATNINENVNYQIRKYGRKL